MVKPRSEYWPRSGSRDGLRGECKACKNRDMKEWRSRNPGRSRSHTLRHRYGLSPHDYELLATQQGNVCAICAKRASPLCVDHSHSTGRVRGLLCIRCNSQVLGVLENEVLVQRAKQYLDNPPAMIVLQETILGGTK